MPYLKAILAEERGVEGEIFINGDLNKTNAYFRRKEQMLEVGKQGQEPCLPKKNRDKFKVNQFIKLEADALVCSQKFNIEREEV